MATMRKPLPVSLAARIGAIAWAFVPGDERRQRVHELADEAELLEQAARCTCIGSDGKPSRSCLTCGGTGMPWKNPPPPLVSELEAKLLEAGRDLDSVRSELAKEQRLRLDVEEARRRAASGEALLRRERDALKADLSGLRLVFGAADDEATGTVAKRLMDELNAARAAAEKTIAAQKQEPPANARIYECRNCGAVLLAAEQAGSLMCPQCPGRALVCVDWPASRLRGYVETKRKGDL